MESAGEKVLIEELRRDAEEDAAEIAELKEYKGRAAQMKVEKPSVIIGHTIMAQGCASMEDDHNTHGAPLPPEEISATKEKLDLNPNEYFVLPKEVLINFREKYSSLKSEINTWNSALQERMKESQFASDWNIVFSEK